eukprot:CAMPEP_0113554430 /NCGR_PEP_ID=MMETSP0015_2-20120614/16145_1 /TAXON_ID=2838 /ORGANISM="Odontella" /LENGTH=441 /DNA_ID=CAMNT_0000455571 /DNA_START=221 /DNA_END=1547 /DNA_ORIENTATION=+ /assembly_acc=CAM_ASM_000160
MTSSLTLLLALSSVIRPAAPLALNCQHRNANPATGVSNSKTMDRRMAAGAMAGAGLFPALLAPSRPASAVQQREELHAPIPDWVAANLHGGRVTVLPNWLPPSLLSSLRSDARALFAEGGHFQPDALAAYSIKKQRQSRSGSGNEKIIDAAYDRTIMPSFFASTGKEGPFANFDGLGDGQSRKQFAALMESVRTQLTADLGRPTLGTLNRERTNEMSYSRYGPGAFLPRHTDEHHGELKKAHPVASGDENLKRVTMSKSSTDKTDASDSLATTVASDKPTRRSVTWLVYLNDDDWNADVDGGHLRVHERAAFSEQPVGARGADLQVGWLKATDSLPEQPVFLDASLPGRSNCALYCCEGGAETNKSVNETAAAVTSENPSHQILAFFLRVAMPLPAIFSFERLVGPNLTLNVSILLTLQSRQLQGTSHRPGQKERTEEKEC